MANRGPHPRRTITVEECNGCVRGGEVVTSWSEGGYYWRIQFVVFSNRSVLELQVLRVATDEYFNHWHQWETGPKDKCLFCSDQWIELQVTDDAQRCPAVNYTIKDAHGVAQAIAAYKRAVSAFVAARGRLRERADRAWDEAEGRHARAQAVLAVVEWYRNQSA